MKKDKLKQALLWHKLENNNVKCNLCNFHCTIKDGNLGNCSVRKNIDGVLFSLNYDKVCAANPDPIEKKPLFHFQPGSKSFSIACVGCNFKCQFCQNWQISQVDLESNSIGGSSLAPELIVDSALRSNCSSIAYTYTEPTIFMELCNDTAVLARQNGLANVFVSNGYMTAEAIDLAAKWLDGINVDLKAFTDDYYKKLCKAKLQPVLDTINYIAKNTNIWMEITTLLIPGENDSEDELKQLADFIVTNTGPDTPWHISRFYPQYKYTSSDATPIDTIISAEQIAKKAGLRYVYPGNIPGMQSENTFCYNCDKLLIQRTGYHISENNITNSSCPGCDTKIAGYQL